MPSWLVPRLCCPQQSITNPQPLDNQTEMEREHYLQDSVQNFEIFAESLFHIWETKLECCLDEMDTSLAEVNHAWEILFIFMLMKLRDGYHDIKDTGL